MGVHNPRGELKTTHSGSTFRWGGRRAESGFACGRGGLGAGSLLGVPVSALRALWMIKIKTEKKSCILTYFGSVWGWRGHKSSGISYNRQARYTVNLIKGVSLARRRRAKRAKILELDFNLHFKHQKWWCGRRLVGG